MLPGCTLHEAVCTAFFDLPESLRRGRLSVESEELLPGQGILGVEDRERFRILEVFTTSGGEIRSSTLAEV